MCNIFLTVNSMGRGSLTPTYFEDNPLVWLGNVDPLINWPLIKSADIRGSSHNRIVNLTTTMVKVDKLSVQYSDRDCHEKREEKSCLGRRHNRDRRRQNTDEERRYTTLQLSSGNGVQWLRGAERWATRVHDDATPRVVRGARARPAQRGTTLYVPVSTILSRRRDYYVGMRDRLHGKRDRADAAISSLPAVVVVHGYNHVPIISNTDAAVGLRV